MEFSYDEAFSRNLGWISSDEQSQLRRKRVAIAGLGGVGGLHMLTLARLGVEKFNVAEMDQVELANFNRQVCANMSTLGQDKIDVMRRLACDINPQLDLRAFPDGVTEKTIGAFLTDVDLYIDGMDFFELDIRSRIFEECAKRKIPAMTTAPLGMGAAHVNFLPGGMTFEEYFRLKDTVPEDRNIQFLVGLSPGVLHSLYLKDMDRVDFKSRKVPSTPMGCQLCAGIAATEALKILLGRSGLIIAPHSYQFDGYRYKLKKTWRPFGNRNWLQRILFHAIRRRIRS